MPRGEPPRQLDRFACYELCVQSPRHITSMLLGIAMRDGVEPLALREDFCGSAAVSRRWIEEAMAADESSPRPARTAIAVDLDHEVIERAAPLCKPFAPALTLHEGDCTAKHAPAGDVPADVIFIGNFSIGYCHARSTLMRYLKHSHARLAASNGVFACDLYGGPNAFTLGGARRRHPSRGHETIHYLWQHEEADPLTGMVTNSISFEIERDGEIIQQIRRAFVYRWRLWPLADLREAMLEVGFRSVEVYTDVNVAPGETPEPTTDPDVLRKDWVAMVVGRA